MITKIYDYFYAALWNVCKALLIVQVIIVAYVVFGRFILHATPPWGEEGALVCMVWFCLVSATIAIRDDSHLRMTVIEMWLPPKVIKMIDNSNQVITFSFALFMLVAGIKLTALTSMSVMAGISISSAWLYAAVPVAGFTIMFALLEKVRK